MFNPTEWWKKQQAKRANVYAQTKLGRALRHLLDEAIKDMWATQDPQPVFENRMHTDHDARMLLIKLSNELHAEYLALG